MTGFYVSEDINDSLFRVAHSMIREGKTKQKVFSDEMDGLVTTSFKETTLGSIYGIEFHAEVVTEHGEGRVKFLVRPEDSKNVTDETRVAWNYHSSTEELLESLDPSAGRKNAEFN